MKERVWHRMILWSGDSIHITPEQRKVFEPAWEQGDTIIRVGEDEALQSSAIARFSATSDPLPNKMLPEHLQQKALPKAPEMSEKDRAAGRAKIAEMRENVKRYGKAQPTDEDKAKVHEREKLSREMNEELKAATTPKAREAVIKKYQGKLGTTAKGAGTGAVTGVRASEKQAITPKPEVPSAD